MAGRYDFIIPSGVDTKHQQSVANTLRWTDDAIARGDYSEALEWLRMLDAIDAEIPAGYRDKRVALEALCRRRPAEP